MAAKASTFRIEPIVQAGLENLSRVLKRPMNQLVNEAVKDYVHRRSRDVERALESTLASLRAYRERDPHFEEAIAAFARNEARYAKEDPAEGEVVVGKLVNGELVEETGSGPIQTEIRQLLDG
jgi:predicted transcriptional regulator